MMWKIFIYIQGSFIIRISTFLFQSFSLVDQLGIKLKSRKRTLKTDEEEQNVPPIGSKEAKKPRTEDAVSLILFLR